VKTAADAAALLAAWEAGAAAPPAARGPAVLDVLAPVDAATSALDLPLPRLAGHAARCHAELFGADVDGVLACRACGGLLDVAVRLTDLLPDPMDAEPAGHTRAGLAVRSPTARDLVAAGSPRCADPRRTLLARCVTAAPDAPVDVAGLTADELAEIDDLLEHAAADALPVVRATCPDCGGDATGVVDAPGLLWHGVAEQAPLLLDEVARLAAAFGWPERDVLALSPLRRAAYLQLARDGASP
jgi:hypothetical protein